VIREPGLGHVYLVGAGTGDPGLVTVAAVDALKSAGVVLCDTLSPPPPLQQAQPQALLSAVGKRSGDRTISQAEINALLVQHGFSRKKVVRLTGGDCFVLGRGSGGALVEATVRALAGVQVEPLDAP